MVKTKGGRIMNPTDAFRKEQRKKEVNRNKMERKFQREAHRLIGNPILLKDELQAILNAEKDGALSKMLRLKKKVLQDAYDQSLKRKKDEEARIRLQSNFSASLAQNGLRPEDSPFYHPTLNPSGLPPPGKVSAFQCPEPSDTLFGMTQTTLPVPKPPPLPPGPRPMSDDNEYDDINENDIDNNDLRNSCKHPFVKPVYQLSKDMKILPPPSYPPPSKDQDSDNYDDDDEIDIAPGMQQKSKKQVQKVLPPPLEPPPGYELKPTYTKKLPPAPPLPPPPLPLMTAMSYARVPPPPALTRAPPYLYDTLIQSSSSMLMRSSHMSSPYMTHRRDVQTKTTITGQSTVVKRPLPQNDKSITKMVPRSVYMKKHSDKKKIKTVRKPDIAPGFGLAPLRTSSFSFNDNDKKYNLNNNMSMDQKINDFLKEVDELDRSNHALYRY